MERHSSLANLLEQHMQERNIRDARLATLSSEMSHIHEFIHRSTIRNWRTGTSKTVKDWRQLVAVAAALQLDEENADELLVSANCPIIQSLRATASTDEQYLFASWPHSDDESAPSVDLHVSAPIIETTDNVEITERAAVDKRSAQDLSSRSASVVESPQWRFPSSLRTVSISALTTVAVITILGLLFAPNFGANVPDASLDDSPQGATSQREQLLLDENFAKGLGDWRTYVHPNAGAEIRGDNKTLVVDVIAPSEKAWHIAVFKPGFVIEEKRSYLLRFRTRGESVNQIWVDVTRTREPRTSVASSARKHIAVFDEWTLHTLQFEGVQAITEAAGGARIVFEFGDSEPETIWLDDVVFEVVAR